MEMKSFKHGRLNTAIGENYLLIENFGATVHKAIHRQMILTGLFALWIFLN